jgi:hypothetical protein
LTWTTLLHLPTLFKSCDRFTHSHLPILFKSCVDSLTQTNPPTLFKSCDWVSLIIQFLDSHFCEYQTKSCDRFTHSLYIFQLFSRVVSILSLKPILQLIVVIDFHSNHPTLKFTFLWIFIRVVIDFKSSISWIHYSEYQTKICDWSITFHF